MLRMRVNGCFVSKVTVIFICGWIAMMLYILRLVCVSLTIIGQPRNSVLIRRV